MDHKTKTFLKAAEAMTRNPSGRKAKRIANRLMANVKAKGKNLEGRHLWWRRKLIKSAFIAYS